MTAGGGRAYARAVGRSTERYGFFWQETGQTSDNDRKYGWQPLCDAEPETCPSSDDRDTAHASSASLSAFRRPRWDTDSIDIRRCSQRGVLALLAFCSPFSATSLATCAAPLLARLPIDSRSDFTPRHRCCARADRYVE
jgi:hypothetical protein